MKTKNNKHHDIKKGSIWSTWDSVEFVITDVKTIGEQNWVFYQNRQNKNNYSCLEGAFRQRFFLNVNHRYTYELRDIY